MSWRKPQQPNEQIGGERRSDRRYEISLDLRWKVLRRKRTLDSGMGRTIDISSGGIFFETGRKLPVGLKVQLSISWPVLLHNSSPLQLTASGRIVRSDNQRAAIEIIQHEFRTAGVSADQRGTLSASARAPFTFRAGA
ncbi:MAG TPA: PilZ domain-containing protein [Bryobacteraceae bacterium]|nr:PilZ domain-containing protein [Bryobacteraceae bacterium]